MANLGSKASPNRDSRWRQQDFYMTNSGTVDFLVTQNGPASSRRNVITQLRGFAHGPCTLKILKGDSIGASVLMSTVINLAPAATVQIDEQYFPTPIYGDPGGSVHASLAIGASLCFLTMLGYTEIV